MDALHSAALPIVYSHFVEHRQRDTGVPCAYVQRGIEPDVEVAQFRYALFGDAPHMTLMVAAIECFDRMAFQVNLCA